MTDDVHLTEVECPHCGDSGYAVKPDVQVASAARQLDLSGYEKHCHIGTSAARLPGWQVIHQ